MTLLSENIRYGRKLKKLTQSELGKMLGVQKATVSGWENDLSNPSIEFLLKMSSIFGIKVDDLLTRNLVKNGFTIGDHSTPNLTTNPDEVNLLIDDHMKYINHLKDSHVYFDEVIIPGIKGEGRTFEVNDNRMAPKLRPGDIISCEKSILNNLSDGSIYVIVSSDGLIMSNIQILDDAVLCVPENSSFKSIEISLTQIHEFWRVKKVIHDAFSFLDDSKSTTINRRLNRIESFLRKTFSDFDE